MVAARVASAAGLRHVSAGDFMRQMADDRGVSILALSREAEGDEAIDEEIDARTARLGEEGDGFVLDARLGWHFIPGSVKVFLDVDPEVAARRIYGAERGGEPENVDLEATLAAVERREASERERFREYYGVDYLQPDNYDLVIDTSGRDVDHVVEQILAYLRSGPR